MADFQFLNFDTDTTGGSPTGCTSTLLTVTLTQSDTASKSVSASTSSVQTGFLSTVVIADPPDFRVRGAVFHAVNASRTGMILRCTGTLLSGSHYYFTLAIGGSAGNNGLAIYKQNSGVFTLLGTDDLFSASFALNQWYALDCEVNGTTLNLRVQRKSDAKWLQTDGSWNTSVVVCATRTDASISGTGGTGGARIIGTADGVFVDSFHMSPLGDTTGYFTAVSPGIDVAANGAFWSPGNVDLAESGGLTVIDNGTYFKTGFSGTSFGINLDVTAFKTASIAVGNWGSWLCSVDGGAFQKIVLSDPGVGVFTYTAAVASGLSAGSHKIVAYRDIVDESNEWTPASPSSPASSVKVVGFHIDTGAALSSSSGIIRLRTKRGIIFGDSIVQGYNTTLDPNGTNAPPSTFAEQLAFGLDMEAGKVGKSGSGWVTPGTGSQTGGNAFPVTFSKLWSGKNRDFSSLDFVVVCLGTNDASSVNSTVQTFLAAARSAVGASCFIVLCTPFTSNARTAEIKSAVATYLAANPSDTKTFVVDSSAILPLLGAAGAYQFDTVHPNSTGHATESNILTGLISRATGGTSTTVNILSCTATVLTSTSARIDWIADPLALKYEILRSTITNPRGYAVVGEVNTGVLTFTDTGVPVGTYVYSVVSTRS